MQDANGSIQGSNAHNDRRGEPRFQTGGEGELTMISPPGSETLMASIVDVSRSGLQVEITAPIELGSNIELRLENISVFGEVGSCRQRASGRYRLGVLTSRIIPRRRG